MTSTRDRRIDALILLTLLALTAAAYWPGLYGGYLYDDIPNIVQNTRLHIHTLAPGALLAAAFSSHAGPLMRPISMLSFALDYYFFGLAPWAFKVTNLVVHLLNGALIFWLTTLILSGFRRRFPDRVTPAGARILALAVAGAWLLHPLNLTPVLYVVQRMASLAALFTVLGLCLYARARLRALDGRGGLGRGLVAALACIVPATLSKETGLLLPVYLLVLEAGVFGFRDADGSRNRMLVRTAIGGGAAAIAAAAAWLLLHPGFVTSGYARRDFTLGQRLLTEPRVMLWYLRMIVAPSVHSLGLYHDDFIVSRGWFQPATTLPAILAVIGLIGTGFVLLRRIPLVGFGILWFFTGQLMESTVFALLIAQEQRNYLADYGILLALAYAVYRLAWRTDLRVFLRTAGAGFLALLFATTLTRAWHWRNPVDQALYAVRHHPRSANSVYMLGRIYANAAMQGQIKNPAPAFTTLERAAALGPSIIPETALIVLSQKLHRPLDPAWLAGMETKLASTPLTPSDVGALKRLVVCAQSACRIPPQSMARVFRAGFASPNLSGRPQGEANLFTIYGQYEINVRGDFAAGERAFRRAVKTAPGVAQYRINLINLYLVMGKLPAAERELAALRTLNRYGTLTDVIAPVARDVERARRARADPRRVAPPT